MVKWWKHSKIRFYYLNTLWNYKFWMHARPVYKEHHYNVDETMDLSKTLNDVVMNVKTTKTTESQKRFSGFMYKGMIYQDNPGIQGVDSETWEVWIRKGLVRL